LNIIVDDEIKVVTKDENIDKKNLCDFFGDIEKNTTKHSKNIYKKKYETSSRDDINVINNIKILHCYKGKEKELPIKTNIWCWWCCHPFDTPPRFIPTKYDELRRRYRVTGNFCSWSCAKAFMMNDSSYITNKSTIMLTSLIREIHGSYYNIHSAPPRTTLKAFGGTMSIEEFRSIDTNEYFEINNHVMQLDDSLQIKHYKK